MKEQVKYIERETGELLVEKIAEKVLFVFVMKTPWENFTRADC